MAQTSKNKDDINKTQSKEILDGMSRFTYFSTFNNVAKEEAWSVGKIKNFKPEETILGDGKGITDFVYFILTGECQMIEILLVQMKKIGRKKLYSLYEMKEKHVPSVASEYSSRRSEHSSIPVENIRDINKSTETALKDVQVHYMQVYVMSAGGCFGLGETMSNRRIVAASNVKVLLFPKHWLLKWNPANIWPRIKHYLERKIPTRQKVFEEFKRKQQWEECKEMLVGDILRNKRAFNDTTLHDVPYSVRLQYNFDFTECEKNSPYK